MNDIRISVTQGDALTIKADALVLKYAQNTYGLDHEVVTRFNRSGKPIENMLPGNGYCFITEGKSITNTNKIIFVGVPPLFKFGYKEIRKFGADSLRFLAEKIPTANTLLMTIHGVGYGLDEKEAFECQLAGLLESVSSETLPKSLSEIIFVEQNSRRADRMQSVLLSLFPSGILRKKSASAIQITEVSSKALKAAGRPSKTKKTVFVAMPFATEFEDCFHFGIQGAVNSLGHLCERADTESFTGDILDWVKKRIASADLVIADLTTANPNVYLEVGYAWGLNKETVLLIKDPKDLKFDTQGQRYLKYTTIKELQEKLTSELARLNK